MKKEKHNLKEILCYSGLNFVDLMVRQGNIDSPPKTPLVPGFECSGIVESVGENTNGFEVSGFKYFCDIICIHSDKRPKYQKWLMVMSQQKQVGCY